MSHIIFKNELGTLFFGGDRSSNLALREISGLGTPEKIYKTADYIDFDGQITLSSRFAPRTINFSFDIVFGDVSAVSAEIYRIFSKSGTLFTYFRNGAKRIEVNQIFAESFVPHGTGLRTFAVTMCCDSPFFSDEKTIKIPCYETIKNIRFDASSNSWNLAEPTVWGSNSNDVIVENKGDELSYPTFHIHSFGDAQNDEGIEILRVSPKDPEDIIQRFALKHRLSDNEDITVCFNRRSNRKRRYIVSSFGTDLSDKRTEDSDLSAFYLLPGENRIILNNLSVGNTLSAGLEYDNQYVEGVY